MLIKKYEKVYLYVCLCKNHSKLETEKYNTYIAEENEVLREDYMKCNIFII